MNAKYYRFLYHPVSHGMCFSASIGAVKGQDGKQILYLSNAGEGSLPESAHADHLHLLILADLEPQTVRQAEAVLGTCGADKVLVPHTENRPVIGQAEVCEVVEMQELQFPDFQLKLFCSDGKLILYAGSTDADPAKNTCTMNVKPCVPELPCSLTVDASNLGCEMRCMLGADHTQCKRHNQRDETYFVDGHLLVGTADLAKCRDELKKYLAGEWKKIRFFGITGETDADTLTSFAEAGKDGSRRYLIGPADLSSETVKAWKAGDVFHTFVFTDQTAGLCVSGCYEER